MSVQSPFYVQVAVSVATVIDMCVYSVSASVRGRVSASGGDQWDC